MREMRVMMRMKIFLVVDGLLYTNLIAPRLVHASS